MELKFNLSFRTNGQQNSEEVTIIRSVGTGLLFMITSEHFLRSWAHIKRTEMLLNYLRQRHLVLDYSLVSFMGKQASKLEVKSTLRNTKKRHKNGKY